MEFTKKGTVWVREKDVVVEVEGNFYDVRREDMRKILEYRQAQGYASIKDALHGAEALFQIVRGSKKALLVEEKPFAPTPTPASAEINETNTNNLIVVTGVLWVDDSNEAEEGGYYQASAVIKGKKIKIELWKEKPNFNGGFGTEFRQVVSKNGDRYWGRPLGQFAFWPDTNFDK